MSQSAVYSEAQAKIANLTLERLGIPSWEEAVVAALQIAVGANPADGWFGPKSIAAWKAWAKKNDPKPVGPQVKGAGFLSAKEVSVPGCVIVNGMSHQPPLGVKFVNHQEPGGIPAQIDDTNERKHEVTQFVLHRGAESTSKSDNGNYALATERSLDQQGFSTTLTLDIDGTFYQHFDPAIRRGRHCANHNVQSDSLDIGGPFSLSKKGQPGQVPTSFQAAIGRADDGKPPMTRGYASVKCWDLTAEQKTALALFLPWYCQLRGIPLTACDDWRTFRLSGKHGTKDPVTNVKGIVAHAQVSDPGRRVDGFLPLIALKASGAPILWRSGADFLKT